MDNVEREEVIGVAAGKEEEEEEVTGGEEDAKEAREVEAFVFGVSDGERLGQDDTDKIGEDPLLNFSFFCLTISPTVTTKVDLYIRSMSINLREERYNKERKE